MAASRAPAVAAVAILSLTLGVGAAILALVDAVLLTAPPVSDPDSLVVLSEVPSNEPSSEPRRATYGTFEGWRDAAGSMASLEAVDGANLTLTGVGPAERVSANDVTPGFLRQLGVTPSLGRTFAAGDSGQSVAIVSDRIWREKLHADPDVIGRRIVLGGVDHTIVGVLPKPLQFDPMAADVWRPIPYAVTPSFRSSYRVSVFARLAPQASGASLPASLNRVSELSAPPSRVIVTPIGSAFTGDAGRTLGVLAAAAGIAVLMAFVNVGGLLLVRSIDRQRELAIRTALGAAPAVIARRMLLETQRLVWLGTTGGAVLAASITAPFARLSLEQFGGAEAIDTAVNWPVLTIVAVAASIGGALCTLPPVLTTARRDVIETLRGGATGPPREQRLRRLFVIVQVTLAFMLVAGMTQAGGTLWRLLNTSPGFDADGAVAMKLSLPSAGYSDQRVVSFYSTLHEALVQRLGGGAIAAVNEIPLDGSLGRRVLRLTPDHGGLEAVVREVTAGYFDVMRIPLLAGRGFDARVDDSAPRRIVISESLAHRIALKSPVGQQLWYSRTEPAEIIGVVADVKHQRLDEGAQPTVYVAAAQAPSRSMVLVARGARPVADLLAVVREEVARLDPGLPVYGVATMHDVIARSRGMRERRAITATFVGFAALATALAAVGLLAFTTHDVLSRRKELALRMAIGARPGRIAADVLRQAAMVLGAGTATGALLSVWVNETLVAAGVGAAGLTPIAVALPSAVVAMAGFIAMIPALRLALASDPAIVLHN